MKGVISASIFALAYLIIVILFPEASGEPRGVTQESNLGQKSKGTSFEGSSDASGTKEDDDESTASSPFSSNSGQDAGHSQKDAQFKENSGRNEEERLTRQSTSNETNPVADLFQITDPIMRNALGALYGAYRGNDQCSRKAFCIMGNYMKDMPGRDLLFLAVGSYIPPEYNLYYEIFKVAVIYGQNCDVYVCIPGTSPTDAASAAKPNVGSSALDSSSPTSSSVPSLQQDPNSNSIPR